MSINNIRLTTLIIYSSKKFQLVTSLIIHASKKLSICHNVVNKSVQGKEADFKINLLPCNIMANQNKSVHPMDLQKYRLYIGVD